MPCDYSEYPANWKKEIVPRILKRAKNCCEDCGIQNKAIGRRQQDGSFIIATDEELNRVLSMGNNKKALKTLKLTKIILTIAHLDHDHKNQDVQDDRLKALCQRCHLKLDMNIHVRNRKYGRGHWEQPKLF